MRAKGYKNFRRSWVSLDHERSTWKDGDTVDGSEILQTHQLRSVFFCLCLITGFKNPRWLFGMMKLWNICVVCLC